jgi:hypothetical protein
MSKRQHSDTEGGRSCPPLSILGRFPRKKAGARAVKPGPEWCDQWWELAVGLPELLSTFNHALDFGICGTNGDLIRYSWLNVAKPEESSSGCSHCAGMTSMYVARCFIVLRWRLT